MSAATLAVLARPKRRTHMVIPASYDHGTHRIETMCGISVPALDGKYHTIECVGGPTPRLIRELSRYLDGNTCLRCTRLAGTILLMYGVRDTGKAMRTW